MEYWLVWASMDYPASWFAQYQRFKIISKILKEWLPMTKNLIKFSWFYWWNFSQLWIPGLDFQIYHLWLLLACGNVWDRFNPLSHCIRGKLMLSLGKSWSNASAPLFHSLTGQTKMCDRCRPLIVIDIFLLSLKLLLLCWPPPIPVLVNQGDLSLHKLSSTRFISFSPPTHPSYHISNVMDVSLLSAKKAAGSDKSQTNAFESSLRSCQRLWPKCCTSHIPR